MKVSEEEIYTFGLASGIITVTCGLAYFLFLQEFLPSWVKYLGIIWTFFGSLFLIGTYLFKKNKLRESGTLLLISGVVSFPLATGFFVGSISSIFAGIMILEKFHQERDSLEKARY